MREDKFVSFLRCLHHLSIIEQDRVVRLFFFKLFSLPDPSALKRIFNIVSRKRNITNEHFAFLLFASLQYLTKFSYDYPLKVSNANVLMLDIQKFQNEIANICLTKNMATLVVNRYVALRIIMGMLERKVTVVDLGCSIGFGLMSLTSTSPRISIHPQLKPFLEKELIFERGIGIDMAVDDFSDLDWVKACILPEIANERSRLDEYYAHFSKKKEPDLYSFFTANFLEVPVTKIVPMHSVDIVWTSNTLYQIGNTFVESYNRIVPVIDYLLKPQGIWIDAYYRSWEIDFASPENPYQVVVFDKATNFSRYVVLESTHRPRPCWEDEAPAGQLTK